VAPDAQNVRGSGGKRSSSSSREHPDQRAWGKVRVGPVLSRRPEPGSSPLHPTTLGRCCREKSAQFFDWNGSGCGRFAVRWSVHGAKQLTAERVGKAQHGLRRRSATQPKASPTRPDPDPKWLSSPTGSNPRPTRCPPRTVKERVQTPTPRRAKLDVDSPTRLAGARVVVAAFSVEIGWLRAPRCDQRSSSAARRAAPARSFDREMRPGGTPKTADKTA